jgi:hypothetical protein
LGTHAEVVLFDGTIAELEQSQSQAEFAAVGTLYHAVPLEHHQKTVSCALVKFQSARHLCQPQRGLAIAKEIKDRKRTIQCLELISSAGLIVSHIEYSFRLVEITEGIVLCRN